MSRSNLFKTLLIIMTIGLMLYTFQAFKAEGANLFSIFTSNILALNWSGQFNLDFLCYLLLSGIWIMWRNKFEGSSIIVGVAAMIVGIILFAPYLLWLTNKENGDIKRVLIGDR
jgi:protein-S-isoprenylcysteine O-methyltransferase Ste14